MPESALPLMGWRQRALPVDRLDPARFGRRRGFGSRFSLRSRISRVHELDRTGALLGGGGFGQWTPARLAR